MRVGRLPGFHVIILDYFGVTLHLSGMSSGVWSRIRSIRSFKVTKNGFPELGNLVPPEASGKQYGFSLLCSQEHN